MPCPHCKSIDTTWEGYETEYMDYLIYWEFDCVCQNCGKEFTHDYDEDMS